MICCELVEDYDDARDNGRPKSCELHVRDREGGAYPLLVASRLFDLSQVQSRPGRPPPRLPGTHDLSFLSSPQIIPLKHIGVPDPRPMPHTPHSHPHLLPPPQHAYKLRALPTRSQRERAEVNLGNERLAEWCEVGALYCGFRPQADVTIRDTPLPDDDSTASRGLRHTCVQQ